MNFYLIGTNNLATNKKTIRYKYRSHYKKYSLVGITSWAKHSRTIILLLKTFNLSCGYPTFVSGKLKVFFNYSIDLYIYSMQV